MPLLWVVVGVALMLVLMLVVKLDAPIPTVTDAMTPIAGELALRTEAAAA